MLVFVKNKHGENLMPFKHTQKGISKLRKWSRSRGFGQPNAVKVSKLTYRIKNPRILMRGVGQLLRM